MKLYYSPGACSLASNIMLREAGLEFQLERVDLKSHRTETDTDFTAINPKGYVPVLSLKDGEVLTEGMAILQYVADQTEATAAKGFERYRVQEWLTFIATEIHKGIGPLFRPDTPEDYKNSCLTKVTGRLDFVAAQLEGRDYLVGDRLTAADPYLFTVLSWLPHFNVDLARWPSLAAFMKRMGERPAVRGALEAEGLQA